LCFTVPDSSSVELGYNVCVLPSLKLVAFKREKPLNDSGILKTQSPFISIFSCARNLGRADATLG